MSTKELAKQYNPADVEQGWYEIWQKNDFFSASTDSDKQPYSILMPPPNVTGMLTMGHVLNHTIQDIYIRWNRMKGKETCWFPGIDHAGIATQTKVEQELRKEKLTRHDLGREKFLERVWAWKEQYGGIIFDQLRALGNSSDWNRTLFTMDESASNAVREVFIRLFDEGLIYRGKRVINWSPVAQSALSDEEVLFREVKEHLYTMRYHLEDGTGTLFVATVRPETIFGDVALAVNPNDERYKHLIGKNVRVPFAGQIVPIIADDYADPTFGTGVVKITPAHDLNDFEVGNRHNLQMPNTINPDGTLNELTGEFAGVERFAARKKIVAKLDELELIEKIEDYTHNVGFSERGGEPVEPYLSDQWFVKMKPLAEPALRVVQNGEIRFFPPHWTKTYEHWMENIRDWCISRQLWWGHRVPVFYASDGSFTAAKNEDEARTKLGLSPDSVLRQDEDVLDTWFSSWLWPLTTMGWLADGETENSAEMEKFLPTDLLVTGPDIIFFWVARMIMASLKFKGTIPFRDVYFTSIIRDGKGRKMSKSLGNSPDPLKVIAKYGADALRFTIVNSAPIGTDIRLAVNEKTQDVEAVEFGRNFANKIWNATRFLLMKQAEVSAESSDNNEILPENIALTDVWIASRFHATIKETQEFLTQYRLNDYAKKLYEFIWNDFCDWYVEIVKIRLQNSSNVLEKQNIVKFSLEIFDGVLRLLHPVMPFISEELWHGIAERGENESLMNSTLPEFNVQKIFAKAEDEFRRVQMIVEEIRGLRGQMNIPPQEKLPVTISSPDEETEKLIDSQRSVISALVRASDFVLSQKISKPKGAIGSVVFGVEMFLTVSGAIDFATEAARLKKEIARLGGMAQGVEAKLSNEKFVANAPEDIITYEKDKLANIRNTIEKLTVNLADLSE